MSAILAGAVLGIAGSGHCAVMCGPLTLTLHAASGLRARRAFVLHQAGRIAVYAAVGALAGVLGEAVQLAGLGRLMAAVVGGAMLWQAATLSRAGVHGAVGAAVGRLLGRVMAIATRTMGPRPGLQAFAFGAINGLLPCGMVYAALAASVAFGDAGAAVRFMVAFGVGSVPALAAVRVAAPIAARLLSHRAPLVTRLALLVLGAALLVQGVRAPAPAAGASSAHAHHHARP
jgi:sulfite exporter TauE/SafE